MSLANIEPAPRRSESELDMVAEMIPANSRPQIRACMVLMARTGRGWWG
ncbi:hypothetical protein [Enterocloster clostridioformis]|nr:hypothetical protein [Enterocloster clostridioformis]MDB2130579.1 hypothetical protein [Enterocloster clostridioformis]MDU1961226.1 hypothetical protein [Enterocloster clostridioformis]QQR02399.1 hypothetical protein I5Q83_09060 [Enterocloster clostridioformis]